MQYSDDWFHAAIQGDLQFVRNNATQFKGQKDEDGNTALMIAAGNKMCQLVDELAVYEYGLKNNIGQTAMMLASIKGCAHCVLTLCQYEAGQITHQGKTALMMALFNGNVDVSKILIYHELHIDNGDLQPETYLDQAMQQNNNSSLQDLKELIKQIRSNPMWQFIQNQARKQDNSEVMVFKSYQIVRKLEQELKKKEMFSQPHANSEFDVSMTNLPPIRTPLQYNYRAPVQSQYQQNKPSNNMNIRQRKEQLEQNLAQIQQDVAKLQHKYNLLERNVKQQLPQQNQVEFLYQKQQESEAVLSGIIKNIEDLRQSLSQTIEYQSNFGGTVMNMLTQLSNKQSNEEQSKPQAASENIEQK